MNLQPVTGWTFRAECYHCHTMQYFGDVVDQRGPDAYLVATHAGGYADLDGEPFKAYYCRTCANSIKTKQLALTNTMEWLPACGGTEVPFTTRTGRRLLYVWRPGTGDHAYLDLNTDVLLTDAEAQLALAT
jgi:hypothetical protein